MKLQELNQIPPGLLETDAAGLEALLGCPTLLHLPGRREPALFISVLLHGNETTGWEAVREVLAHYDAGSENSTLPRSVSLFIGNVAAAAQGVRRLDHQPDYNRVWTNSDACPTPEHRLIREVVEIMRNRGLFASVDIHNNTGLNPHYACINVIDNRFLHLAALFSRTLVYFLRPQGVQSMVMAEYCPAVTLECGKPGQPHGVAHVREFLDACFNLAEHPTHAIASQDVHLFHTVATVKVLEPLSIGFGGEDTDIRFAEDLDRFNFRELSPGTRLGKVRPGKGLGLEVRDEKGRDVASRYFALEEGELKVVAPVMPSMLTLDRQVVRQDCLCYLMERYDRHLRQEG